MATTHYCGIKTMHARNLLCKCWQVGEDINGWPVNFDYFKMQFHAFKQWHGYNFWHKPFPYITFVFHKISIKMKNEFSL